ncbi:helix-turn-helix domain-containing protein [Falsiroseomonas sp. E2-1-a4]|uniref:helix-turn-helix domain-containing protein n=1 Tax=Falsiroseomonas sp. E2-1-a4 TaxID=3239299 RepID=UPI003F385210
MPYHLIAKIDTHLKADRNKHSKVQPDTDKLRVARGDVIKAPDFPLEGRFFIVRNAVLKGAPIPGHIIYALDEQWTLEDAPEQPVAALPAATAAAPAVEPAPAAAQPTPDSKMAQAKAMLAAGKTVSAIAKELRVGRASIKRWRDEA